jgi:T5orf172 domain
MDSSDSHSYTSFDFSSEVEHVYIVYEREYLSQNKPVYKIGQTSREAQDRFKAYSKSTRIMVCMNVVDSKKVERDIIDEFKEHFIQRTDIGTESFEGDLMDMIDLFYKIVRADYNTPSGNVNSVSVLKRYQKRIAVKRSVTPLTLEHIKSKIPLYDQRMIKNTKEGLKEWILNLITCEGGPNLKCIDRDKPTFTRLNEKGKWVKDGVKFMGNIFKEVDCAGKSLLSCVQEYWLEVKVKDAKLLSEVSNPYNIELKELDAYIKILENQKVIRSRFLKEILYDIAYERYPKEYVPIYTSNDSIFDVGTDLGVSVDSDLGVSVDSIYPKLPCLTAKEEQNYTFTNIKEGLLNIMDDIIVDNDLPLESSLESSLDSKVGSPKKDKSTVSFGIKYPFPLDSYPPVQKGIMKCYQEVSFEPFKDYVPERDGQKLTKWYVDHIDPLFVTEEFVCKSVMKEIHIPTSANFFTDAYTGPRTIDVSPNELVLLKAMGYTRWPEVKVLFEKYKIDNPDIIETFSTAKKMLLQDYGVL